MANEFPQLQDSQPVLHAQPIQSDADSHEAFAKTLSSFAEKAEQKVEKIEGDKSNAMYLASIANIDDLKLSTKSLLLTDPSNAARHMATLRDSIDKVLSISYVNDEDRQKLNAYAHKSSNEIELEAVHTEVKQAQIGTSYEHYQNWPFQLNALRDAALDPDPTKLESLQKSMLEQLRSLVLTGAMTPIQAGAAIESMEGAIDLAHDAYRFAIDEEKHTPENFHKVMANPYSSDKTDNVHYPADEGTKWMINYHADDRSFQGAVDALQQHLKPDMETLENLTPNQRKQLIQEYDGVRSADALIDSNSPLPKIKSRISDLESRSDYKSTAEKKALKNYVKELSSGNSQQLMARTTLGGQIVRDYTDRQSYLTNELSQTDPKNISKVAAINSEIAKNKNDYVNKSIAFAEAHHWPTVSPIPKEDVVTLENGFNVAGNPAENAAKAYQTLSQYSKQNQMYAADQMKNPRHKVVLQTIALGGNETTQSEKIDFIAANQNRKYKELDPHTEDAITDDYLRNTINTKIPNALKVISAQNSPINATVLNEQLIGASINYAKFISEKNGEYSMKKEGTFNSVNNVSAVAQFVNKSYDVLSGANYIVNKNQVPYDDKEMSEIAQYAIDKGNEYLRENMSESAYIALQNQAPLTVTVTPTNILIAKDAAGNIAYRQPLTRDIAAAAAQEVKRKKKEQEKEIRKQYKKSVVISQLLPEEGEGNAE